MALAFAPEPSDHQSHHFFGVAHGCRTIPGLGVFANKSEALLPSNWSAWGQKRTSAHFLEDVCLTPESGR